MFSETQQGCSGQEQRWCRRRLKLSPQNGYCQTLSRNGGWRYPASPSFSPISSLVQCRRDPIRSQMTRKPTYHADHAIVLEAAEESGGVHILEDTK